LQHLLLVDLGGSGLKAMLCRPDGQPIAQTRFDNAFDEEASGVSEQDPNEWWHALRQAADDLSMRAPVEFSQIAAIVICGFTRTQVFLSNQGQSLRPAITFRDHRASAVVQQMQEQLEMKAHPLARHFNPFHPLARLLWLKQHEPHHWQALSYMVEPKDYLNFKLTGTLSSDPISQFWLLEARRANPLSLWQVVGLEDRSPLPALYPPNQKIGQVQADLPAPFNQLQGAAVLCGAPDTWTAAAGLGAIKPNCGYGISGSSEVFGLISPVAAAAEGLITIPWGENLWQIGGPGQNGANLVEWWVKQCDSRAFFEKVDTGFSKKNAIKQETRAVDCVNQNKNRSSTQAMEEKITRLLTQQSHRPLLFYPFLNGERTPFWDEDLTAAFIGLTSAHMQGDQLRAVMEGVGFVNRLILERAEAASGQKAQEIRLAGGGTRDPFWNQIRANILNRPILVAKAHDMGLRGALTLARSALGYEQEEEGEIFELYTAHPHQAAHYEALYRLFISHLPAIENISHRLSAIGRQIL